MKNIRVLIIDEHPAVCQALASRLGAVPSVTVVGAMSDFSEGLRSVSELQPDVILLELKVKSKGEVRRRDLEPVGAINRLGQKSPAGIIVLTTYLDDVERERALGAGARRYLLKQIDTAHLVTEIEAVADGREKAPAAQSERAHPLLLSDGRATLDKAVNNIQERDR